jgi:hypothetical protein
MKNDPAATTPQKSALILGPAKIKVLENLNEHDRSVALTELGVQQLRRAQEEWRRIGKEALAAQANLQDGEDHFYATTESRDERRAYEKRIEDAAGDVKQADLVFEILDRYLSILEITETVAALVARAEERRANFKGAAKLDELKAALAAAAAILADINQHNGEANAINPYLPNGCEPIQSVDVRIIHLPGHSSLIGWLTSQLSTIAACFPEPIIVRPPPGVAAYPEPVKAALARLDETRRAQIVAARGVPRGQGNATAHGSWRAPIMHALPPREPEPIAPSERGFQPTVISSLARPE